MKFTQINKEQTKAMAWASGTTTELFIYPSNGNFLTRDFLFRISTATVEAEETTFSDFSGLTRILMPLEGNLTLIHEGRYTKSMVPFEQDTFDGGWSTKSKGKVRDFNVMFKAPAEASLQVISMDKDQNEERIISSSFVILYANSGRFECNDFSLNKGDLLVIEDALNSKANLKCLEFGELLFVEIFIK